jgi:hypothetical protein
MIPVTSTEFSPLHVEAPRLVADVALGEQLAALARASAPSGSSRVRRSGWRVPLAAVATIAASSGVAYAGQAALNEQTAPQAPVSSGTATTSATASTSAPASAVAHTVSNAGAQAKGIARAIHQNPHGKTVGPGHPKTGKAKGHPATHDSGKHGANNPNKTTTSVPNWFTNLERKSAGSAGVAGP